MNEKIIEFQIIGLLTSEPYQKCKSYSLRLHRNIPEKFAPPKLRPMLDVQWTDFLTKTRRNYGPRLWMFDTPVIVFENDLFFGSENEFVKYCNLYFRLHLYKNFEKAGQRELQRVVENSGRTYVYFIISIDGVTIGTLLFRLYTDLVPLTCENFLRLCHKRTKGYKNAPIHRIAASSWIQIGGHHLKRHRIPCENYNVPHDQRGVLSMCNHGKHKHNHTQCFVSLNPTPWMDYYYVAFGQLVHGEDILTQIERVPVYYETPCKQIVIEDCGEYTFKHEPDQQFLQDYENYLRKYNEVLKYEDADVQVQKLNVISRADFRDCSSYLNLCNYEKGLYDLPN